MKAERFLFIAMLILLLVILGLSWINDAYGMDYTKLRDWQKT